MHFPQSFQPRTYRPIRTTNPVATHPGEVVPRPSCDSGRTAARAIGLTDCGPRCRLGTTSERPEPWNRECRVSCQAWTIRRVPRRGLERTETDRRDPLAVPSQRVQPGRHRELAASVAGLVYRKSMLPLPRLAWWGRQARADCPNRSAAQRTRRCHRSIGHEDGRGVLQWQQGDRRWTW